MPQMGIVMVLQEYQRLFLVEQNMGREDDFVDAHRLL